MCGFHVQFIVRIQPIVQRKSVLISIYNYCKENNYCKEKVILCTICMIVLRAKYKGKNLFCC
jgi:hypothetical protein